MRQLVVVLWCSASAWAGNGTVVTSFGTNTLGNEVRIFNSKVWFAGSGGGSLAMARYTINGLVDYGFSLDGQVQTNFSSNEDIGNAIAFGSGKSLVAGSTGFEDPLLNCTSAIIARYNSDGTLDTSFSSNGKLTTKFGLDGCWQSINDIRVDGSLNIWVVGLSSASGDSNVHPVVARYLWNGSPDTSFGSGGVVHLHMFVAGPGDYPGPIARRLAFFGDGSVVVAGDNLEWWMVKLLSTGAVDTTFGTAGVVTAFNQGSPLVLARDVRVSGANIVISGQLFNTCVAVARYTTGGAVDGTFGSGGLTTLCSHLGGSFDFDSQGRIVVAGNNSSFTAFEIMRLTSAGVLDTTFGTAGLASVAAAGGAHQYGLAIDGADGATVSGTTFLSGASYGELVRVTSAGVLDTTFGGT